MDKETLSNYGWIVICVLVLAVMIALAGPFGTFVAGAVKSTTAGLFGVNQNALNAAGITIGDQAFANCEHLETEIRNATADYSGDTYCKECGTILSTGTYVIPEGGTYTAADGTVYNPGDGFPETVTTGDAYKYGNYEYRYNQYHTTSWNTNEAQNGWGVRCRNSVAEPGPILESINGEPITNMYSTFWNCSALTTAPVIPTTVINLYNAFGGCYNLKTYIGSTDPDGDFSGYVIPSNVTTMYFTFTNCKSLTTAPDLSNATSVKSMDSTFDGCTSLVNIDNLVIPENTTSMQYMLKGCTALIDASKLVIPEKVVNVCGVFQNCKNLKNAPIMPKNAYRMYWLFENCTSLTGTITFNTEFEANIWAKDSMSGVDFEAQNLTLTGTSTYLDGIGRTGVNYCETCNGKCQGNH